MKTDRIQRLQDAYPLLSEDDCRLMLVLSYKKANRIYDALFMSTDRSKFIDKFIENNIDELIGLKSPEHLAEVLHLLKQHINKNRWKFLS